MKNLLAAIIVTFLFLSTIPLWEKIQAAYLKFDQSTVSTSNGGTFQIAVQVEPGSDSLNSVDAYVLYDSSLVSATSVSAGSLFPTVSHDESTSGKVYIAGMVNDVASSVSTTGTLATITYKGLKDGSGNLSFDCNLSKIVKNDINATNVIVCSQNGTASVTVGSGSQPTTAPQQLPESGVFDNVVKFAVPGMILLLLGGAFRLLL